MAERNISGVVQKFITTDKMHRSLFEKRISAIGLHRSQHRVIMYLAKNQDKKLAQKDLAEKFSISPAAVAVTLKKLESEGYIKKTVFKEDNRINNISVTEKALRVVEKTEECAKELEEFVFKDFTDSQLQLFCECLDKMQKAISCYDEIIEKENKQ
ncbi:MAG: MarR family transcriptional regulator [Clostridiales bacterium]|nr:MAG: MarR family transcriptional regulator [Clostridiales bacterium]